ncbi:hypothetical protein V9L05_15265 [Bernardetia sp. Wsw4-3y2]|uniref:hypothetical protein n=1 Tax=Bernardetia sp. Wsw4-3y2 TaxID=3127471 RepID=UPI0030CE7AD1
MLNSKNATVAAKKNASKSTTKKPFISEKEDTLKTLKLESVKDGDMIYEVLAAEKELEETKAQLENVELENATLRANAKHADQDIKKELEATKAEAEKLKLEILEIKTLKEENEKIKKQAAEQKKNAELLKTELQKAQKPTHATAEEKLNRLKKANDISIMLERRKQLFNEFQKATTGDEQEQFKIIFVSSNGSKFELAKNEIVSKLTDITHNYMQNTISETEQELLSYQI